MLKNTKYICHSKVKNKYFHQHVYINHTIFLKNNFNSWEQAQ